MHRSLPGLKAYAQSNAWRTTCPNLQSDKWPLALMNAADEAFAKRSPTNSEPLGQH